MLSGARKILPIDKLMRRSTMQNHIKIQPLKQPDGQPRVELIKLRASFEPFLESQAKDGASPVKASKTKLVKEDGCGHDILVTLLGAVLVELQPLTSGWYAVFLVYL